LKENGFADESISAWVMVKIGTVMIAQARKKHLTISRNLGRGNEHSVEEQISMIRCIVGCGSCMEHQ
jgi:hypothetical protein